MTNEKVQKCTEDIAKLTGKHYSTKTWCLDTKAVLTEAIAEYGREMVERVIASNIRLYHYDGRVEQRNVTWANTILAGCGPEFERCDIMLYGSHIGLADLMATALRKGEV